MVMDFVLLISLIACKTRIATLYSYLMSVATNVRSISHIWWMIMNICTSSLSLSIVQLTIPPVGTTTFAQCFSSLWSWNSVTNLMNINETKFCFPAASCMMTCMSTLAHNAAPPPTATDEYSSLQHNLGGGGGPPPGGGPGPCMCMTVLQGDLPQYSTIAQQVSRETHDPVRPAWCILKYCLYSLYSRSEL